MDDEKKKASRAERLPWIAGVWILALVFAFVPVPFFQDLNPWIGFGLAVGLTVAIYYYDDIFGGKNSKPVE
jgi:membrane protease YdiL (CAAX protease family)